MFFPVNENHNNNSYITLITKHSNKNYSNNSIINIIIQYFYPVKDNHSSSPCIAAVIQPQ